VGDFTARGSWRVDERKTKIMHDSGGDVRPIVAGRFRFGECLKSILIFSGHIFHIGPYWTGWPERYSGG
jgi:hypothetical protein